MVARRAVLLLVCCQASAFVNLQQKAVSVSSLQAGKGFGKKPAPEKIQSPAPSTKQPQPETKILKSLDNADATPIKIDESIPVEERTARILKEQYGMKTLAEQQFEGKQLENYKAQQKRIKEFKQKAESGADFDVMALIPGPAQLFIDRVLKLGVGVCAVLFVLAGLGITVEAYSKSMGDPLPENIDNFIVNIIEPNFTPGFLVLLGFSISLGVFSALQLSSSGATYREDQ